MSKQDHNEIMRELGAIRSDIGTINNHLEELNGKVARNVSEIQELKLDSAIAENKRQDFQSWQENRSEWNDWAVKGIASVIGAIILIAIVSALENVDLSSYL